MDDIEPVTKDEDKSDNDLILWIVNNVVHNSESNTLKYQIQVISHLKYVDFHEDKSLIIKCLSWLQSTTKDICTDKKLPLLLHNTSFTSSTISRSSYFFCKYGVQCRNKNKTNGCTRHHFVYHLLYADISSLLSHITESKTLIISEIQKSISTINYVMYHMSNELKASY